jgi:hypothetical protein
MILKTVTALALRLVASNRRAGNAPLIVAPPCQSEIKRTLRRRLRAPRTVFSPAFAVVAADDSIAMVNVGFPRLARYGFEMVDMPVAAVPVGKNPVNRKFTANRISRFLRSFSPI